MSGAPALRQRRSDTPVGRERARAGRCKQMYDYESLTTEIIKFPPRAVSQDWKAVTVADVTEMLRQARVREPWHAPGLGCFSLAQCINNPLGSYGQKLVTA